ncbi:DNA-directed DNA polymerase [Parasponia andersonii]|uniref:DNA-directed DNA polymerase n=1 Tax=Parasponia andersonii TaxID=3476 RepID=A0A2P5D5M9_PARAD|nr:DNA-directed DNA polymerase [Parasponia andersonii]
MAVNITSIKTSSNGAWQGDNPLDFAFPLLIVQTTLILVLSRFLAFLLKPLRQPKVIAEIVGGILLGPSAFGRNKEYLERIFPKWSSPILESVASIGLLFFLFLVGLELDLSSIRRSGRRAFGIALAGITLPFVCGIGVAFVLRKAVQGADQVGYGQFLVFMGVSLSITAFPVLARILAELKLLTTRIGETAMAAAAFNDVAAWILLALAVALAGDGDGGGGKSPLVSVWVLMSGVGFVVFMLLVVQPAMKWVARQYCSSEVVDEAYICLTLAGVMVSGFVTDLIGIHAIFGAFVFGLTIPKGGGFADRLIERIEDFVSGLLLPLYFASSGLKTDVAKISGGKAWGLLVLVITTACAGKIIGTFVVAMMVKIPARESLALGVLMNTKGLVELIVLNIGKEKKVLNDEIFAILVLMALFTTFITTPTVMAIYKPSRGGSGGKESIRTHRKLCDLSISSQEFQDELRILACVHGPGNVPSLISVVESTRSTKKAALKLFIMHLVELTERSSAIVMVQRVRKNGLPFFKRFRRGQWHDRVAGAFQTYEQLGRVSVSPTTAISPLSTMHEDICHAAEEKGVAMIILPFHKQWNGTDKESVENVGHGWRLVNQRVLKNSPCSVAVLVDRGLSFGGSDIRLTPPGPPNTSVGQRVCVVFFGGPDDRECLELGGRMAEHPAVKVTVVRFVNENKEGLEGQGFMLRPSPTKSVEVSYSFSTATMNLEKEKELDETAVAEFKSKWINDDNDQAVGMQVEYIEKVVGESNNNIVEQVLGIGRSGDYDLIIVGKGRFPSKMVAELADRHAEHPELGPIGDILASLEQGMASSVLVIQQHDLAHTEELPVSKVFPAHKINTNRDQSSSSASTSTTDHQREMENINDIHNIV